LKRRPLGRHYLVEKLALTFAISGKYSLGKNLGDFPLRTKMRGYFKRHFRGCFSLPIFLFQQGFFTQVAGIQLWQKGSGWAVVIHYDENKSLMGGGFNFWGEGETHHYWGK